MQKGGILLFDILAFILQTEVLSLDAVSAEILGDEKIEMEYGEIVEAWTEEKNLGKLSQYCLGTRKELKKARPFPALP